MGEMQIIEKEHAVPYATDAPTLVLPGGGKRLRFHDGHEVVIGGEALRHALRQRRILRPSSASGVASTTSEGPCFSEGYVADGKEIVVDISRVAYWTARGGKD